MSLFPVQLLVIENVILVVSLNNIKALLWIETKPWYVKLAICWNIPDVFCLKINLFLCISNIIILFTSDVIKMYWFCFPNITLCAPFVI